MRSRLAVLPLALAAILPLAACNTTAPTSTAEPRDNGTASVPAAVPADAPSASNATATANTATAATNAADPSAYLGRWIGVEGMYLVVTRRAGDAVSLEMQWDLDNKGTFDGTVATDGVRFTRNGVTETLRPSDGDATGLKYLSGKKNCLTVKSGEGYCRD